MVARADLERRRSRLANTEFVVMDAHKLHFAADTFDLIFCAFALYLFDDAKRVLREARRVLRSGGKLAVSTWLRGDPDWDWYEESIRQLRPSCRPLWQRSLTSAEELHELLRSSHFSDVLFWEEELRIQFRDEDEWWSWLWSHGERSVVLQLTLRERRRLRHIARSHLDGDGITSQMRLGARFALAQPS
jgi:SAM-dependent methyltransferase